MMESGTGADEKRVQVKVPRKIIHFTSGETIEEYDTDDESMDEQQPSYWEMWKQERQKSRETGAPVTLLDNVISLCKGGAYGSLAVADYLGENLAYYLGITTPKFQYVLDHREEILQEIEAEKAEKDVELEIANIRKTYSEESDSQATSRTNMSQPESYVATVSDNIVSDGIPSPNVV